MRLMERRNVDLPQPDGPTSAVTVRGCMESVMPCNACFSPYQNEKFSASTVPRLAAVGSTSRGGSATIALTRTAR